jgi:hypothetical protein
MLCGAKRLSLGQLIAFLLFTQEGVMDRPNPSTVTHSLTRERGQRGWGLPLLLFIQNKIEKSLSNPTKSPEALYTNEM